MERTTNIRDIENNGAEFTWGIIIKLHKIGEYSIAEYNPWKTEGCEVLTGDPSEEIEYHAWIGEKDTARGYHTLESAIVGTIAYKYDGANSQAGSLFCRMLDIR